MQRDYQFQQLSRDFSEPDARWPNNWFRREVMHKNINTPIPDMHDEAWWLRAMDGDLTQSEHLLWEEHLNQCESCHNEWKVLMGLDSLLRAADPPPLLPADFTARTVAHIMRQQRVQRLVSLL